MFEKQKSAQPVFSSVFGSSLETRLESTTSRALMLFAVHDVLNVVLVAHILTARSQKRFSLGTIERRFFGFCLVVDECLHGTKKRIF
jgi:hypothetical protein